MNWRARPGSGNVLLAALRTIATLVVDGHRGMAVAAYASSEPLDDVVDTPIDAVSARSDRSRRPSARQVLR